MANENLVVPRFYVHSKLNKIKSREAGRPIYDDIEVCEIRFSANKQTVGVFPAHEVFTNAMNAQTGENEPMTYAMAYKDQYIQFKNGTAQVLAGTPLAELPFLTQSKRLELKALNIHTAEALAALDGQPLKQLGMGGRELKMQAQAYIDKAAGNADVAVLASRLAALEAENERLRNSTFLPDDEAEAMLAPSAETVSPFHEWESDDIRNWIEANHGDKPRGNASHASLVKQADELNAELTKKAKSKEAA